MTPQFFIGESAVFHISKTLKRIWTTRISEEFDAGDLVSEGDLRASMYHHLRCLSLKGVKIFAECKGGFLDRQAPDLVIARNKEIEAVVEFKFYPGYRPVPYQKDVRKLANWCKRVSRKPVAVYLQLNPFTREYVSPPEYLVTDSTIWIFACIGAPMDPARRSCTVGDCVRHTYHKAPLDRFWLMYGSKQTGAKKPIFKAMPLA